MRSTKRIRSKTTQPSRKPSQIPHRHTSTLQSNILQTTHTKHIPSKLSTVTTQCRKVSISTNKRGADPATLSRRVISHWFQDYNRGEPVSEICRNKWFRSHPELDAYMVHEFRDDFYEYRSEKLSSQVGPYTEIGKEALGALALSILAFQYPRAELRHLKNINEGVLTPEIIIDSHLGPTGRVAEDAFLEANYTSIQMLHPLRFDVIERSFFFLPLTQIEQLNPQKIAVARLSDLVDEAPRMHRPYISALREFAFNHLDVIQRFGRFPQRNALLARDNTPEEEEYLRTECGDWEKILIVDPYATTRSTNHDKHAV